MKAYKDDSNTTRISVLETVVSQISQTMIRLETKIDNNSTKLENKIENLHEEVTDGFKELDNKINDVRKENTSHFRTTIFTLLTLIGTPLLMESIKLLTNFIHKS